MKRRNGDQTVIVSRDRFPGDGDVKIRKIRRTWEKVQEERTPSGMEVLKERRRLQRGQRENWGAKLIGPASEGKKERRAEWSGWTRLPVKPPGDRNSSK